MLRVICLLIAAVVVWPVPAGAQVSRLPAEKKLIEYGWDVPTP